ncbi:unnamed protein product [Parnassius apollo]|uniref:(apollo) hypothetical protein n=1 Tax=Parnassius apollo TaxID=110799 RepID=A0A8S3X821_PARAO|nr:unnamed protein product [Parnassius apollo]
MSRARDSSTESESGPSTPKKIKKKHYTQKLRDEWLSDTNFKTSLQRDPKDPFRTICVMCDAKMFTDRVSLKRHSEGIKHIKKTKSMSSEEKRKTAEIKLAAFMAEHKNLTQSDGPFN